MIMSLSDYGWSPFFSGIWHSFDRHFLPGRIVLVHRDLFVLQGEAGETKARISGRLRREADNFPSRELPVIGDWVAWAGGPGEGAVIHEVLPRKSLLARKRPGSATERQAVAANVDTVFLVMGLDEDFNLRRLERMLAMTYESGASPVVVLTKTDLVPAEAAQRAACERAAPGVPVLPVSSLSGQGLDKFQAFLGDSRTVVFVGSSGAGKSTLINCLFGEEAMRTAPVRARDGRGCHTTTHRQLLRHPAGALLIDNPGIREVGLWGAEGSLEAAFADVELLAEQCRFRDCSHTSEPGCAVRQAETDGTLPDGRLENYRKLTRELRYLEIKQDEGAERAQKRKWKAIHKAARKDKRLRP
jgi:ribosome biogenesis GTPase / thiamine phosphate phosphatase